MSVRTMAKVWDMSLEPGEKLVLLAYADHADHSDGNMFPAIETVAKKTGYTERHVQRITRALEEKGVLVADGKGVHGTNKWRLGGGDIMSGVTSETSGVTSKTLRGDTHVTRTIIEPSLESMASSENALSAEDEQEPAVESGKGMVQLSIENQIYAGVKQITLPDNKDAAMRDSANLIAMGMKGIDRDLAYSIAYTFMKSRGIIIPADKVKGQRKVIASMLKQGVLPDHVQTAVSTLIEKGMTVTDLYSIEKTAVSLANPPQKGAGFYLEGL